MVPKRAFVLWIFCIKQALKYLIVNLTFIIILHEIAITFTQY